MIRVLCKHCGDKIEHTTCGVCGDPLFDNCQCLVCHVELAHDRVANHSIDVYDPKSSIVSSEPPIPRPTSSAFERDPICTVHEGMSGQSLADGFAMLEGYESAEDKYRTQQRERRKRGGNST